MSFPGFFQRHRHIFLYGFSLAALLLLLNWLKLKLIVTDHAFEVYVGLIALLFTGLGIWLATALSRRTASYNHEPPASASFTVNESAVERLNLSKRELEVLQLMAKGLSNREIAERLFISISTVKTHSNKLFDKMGVKRRTQAIERGRQNGVIP